MALNPIQSAIQAGQQAILSHPFAQQLAEGIKGLQQQHQRTFAGRKFEQKNRKVVVPPRPAPFAAIIPGDSVGEAVITTGLLNFFQLYNTALIIRLVLTWFPNPPEFIVAPLATVTDPYLGLFRGIIPPLGGTLDLSPILAFVTLNFFTSATAALPCDNSTAAARNRQQVSHNPFSFLQPSKFQQAWDRRVRSQRAARQAADSDESKAQ